jgi:NAD(P)-dependent dehydrogenase (short-subunit alcohol dehydrogenase family)
MTRFDGRTALVTGGTSGIGLATAQRLRAEGARVIVTGRSTVESPDFVRADVARLSDLDRLAAVVRERLGRLDVVFANAGVATFGAFDEVTEAEYDRVMGINVKGVYFTLQKLAPLLADDAAVVINASWTLHRGLTGGSLYAATKAAVHNLARSLAAELAPVRVNSISPGYITTPMFHANVEVDAQPGVRSAIPLDRFGTAEDVAEAVAFLASREASYITGQDLIIDGGLVPTARVSNPDNPRVQPA